MIAKARVPAGAPDHSSGGEVSAPSHVCTGGMPASGANAALFNVNEVWPWVLGIMASMMAQRIDMDK